MSNINSRGRFVYIVLAICVFLYASFTCIMIYTVRTAFHYKKEYNFDLQRFENIIKTTTTNYLSKVVNSETFSKSNGKIDNSTSASATETRPIKVTYENFAFWEIGKFRYARYRGCDVGVGDLLDIGFVLSISPNTIILRTFEGNLHVVKNVTPSESSPRPVDERDRRGEDSEGYI